jgi:enoyl-[acyl-carrier-protein] reductase (NADH)
MLDKRIMQLLKAGVIGFSKSVALELGSRNIRCNVIVRIYRNGNDG